MPKKYQPIMSREVCPHPRPSSQPNASPRWLPLRRPLRLSLCLSVSLCPHAKVLDPGSPASPGWGDGRCGREGECVSFRVGLEVATQDLRVGVRVKVSTLEKALLPTGTVTLLELYLRGSVSVRAELRDEFPFVSTVSEQRIRSTRGVFGGDDRETALVDVFATARAACVSKLQAA